MGSAHFYLKEILLETLAPTRCCGCDAYGPLMCDKCLQSIHEYDFTRACKECGSEHGAIICTECFGHETLISKIYVLSELKGPLGRGVRIRKDQNEQRLSAYFAYLLGTTLRLRLGIWAEQLCYVPATKEALKRRGFNHCLDLAKALGATIGLEPQELVTKKEHIDLRRLSRSARKQVSKNAYAIKCDVKLKSRVLLVDDVLTTGATLESIAEVLLKAGVKEVRACVIARTS